MLFSWTFILAYVICASQIHAERGGHHDGVSPMPGMMSKEKQQGRCEEITIPMCRGIGYNKTLFPNEMNHETQDEAGLEVHQFWPLVEIKCSADLKFFLCSMYTPICMEDYHKPLPACQSVCERARAGCAPIMQQYSFSWPERMACENFPKHGDHENLCMEQNNYVESSNSGGGSGSAKGAGSGSGTRAQKPTSTPKSGTNNLCKGKNSKNCSSPPGMEQKGGTKECTCKCNPPLVNLTNMRDNKYYNISAVRIAGVPNCAIPCRGAFFTKEEKEFTGIWIAVWSSLCFVSTLMTLTTFLIDTKRFKYPERPIVFLSACYFMVSIGYLTRVSLGHEEVACDGPTIKYSTIGPSSCNLVFILTYFFGMASSIWWVVLSFTWFLAAGLKWGNEAITKHSQYFHLAAWLIPTVQSVGVILLGGVDGDPVSGICYVGNLSSENLRTFVLAPLFVYLVVGTSFLMAGFVSLFRIRSVIKQQGGIGAGTKADKLEKLMIRIGIFSVLYTVPATIVIGCYLYETTYSKDWNSKLRCPCLVSQGIYDKPLYSVIMLKYFMALAVGITSGVWIWSGKTVESWRRLWRRLFGIPDRTGANQALIKQKIDNRLMPRPYVPGANDDVETVLESLRRQNPGAPAISPSTIQMLEQHLIKAKQPISHV